MQTEFLIQIFIQNFAVRYVPTVASSKNKQQLTVIFANTLPHLNVLQGSRSVTALCCLITYYLILSWSVFVKGKGFFVPGCSDYLVDVIIAKDPVAEAKVLYFFRMSLVETLDSNEQYACDR